MAPRTQKKEKRKTGKPEKPSSDFKLVVVLGAALLLALFIIWAVMLTTPSG